MAYNVQDDIKTALIRSLFSILTIPVTYGTATINALASFLQSDLQDIETGRIAFDSMTITVKLTDVASPAIGDPVTALSYTWQVARIQEIDTITGVAVLMLEKRSKIERSAPEYRGY